jgi:hypothetical protein
MIAIALQQRGFDPTCCEPKDADTELRRRRYRVLITSEPTHLRRDQIPTIYLAPDSMEFVDDLPAHMRIVAKPFGVEQLVEMLWALMRMQSPVRRKLSALARVREASRFKAGG